MLIGRICPVHSTDRFWLILDIGDNRNFRLHAECCFVIGDGGFDNRAIRGLLGKRLVLFGKQIDFALLDGARIGRSNIVDRNAFGAHHGGLMAGRQERASEIFQPTIRNPVVVQDHVPWQVLIVRTKAIRDPSAKTGCLTKTSPGMEQQVRLTMQRQFSHHRPDHADLIRHAGNMREKVTNP